jgi:hypothetical protein
MNEAQACKRIKLAGSEGCNVIYCEACAVAEVTIGAMSVRVDLDSLYDLQAVLTESLMKLSVLKATTVSPDFDYNQLNLQ